MLMAKWFDRNNAIKLGNAPQKNPASDLSDDSQNDVATSVID